MIIPENTRLGQGPVQQKATAKAPLKPRRIDSDSLFEGAKELLIQHAGEQYSLRQTSKGKLILTK